MLANNTYCILLLSLITFFFPFLAKTQSSPTYDPPPGAYNFGPPPSGLPSNLAPALTSSSEVSVDPLGPGGSPILPPILTLPSLLLSVSLPTSAIPSVVASATKTAGGAVTILISNLTPTPTLSVSVTAIGAWTCISVVTKLSSFTLTYVSTLTAVSTIIGSLCISDPASLPASFPTFSVPTSDSVPLSIHTSLTARFPTLLVATSVSLPTSISTPRLLSIAASLPVSLPTPTSNSITQPTTLSKSYTFSLPPTSTPSIIASIQNSIFPPLSTPSTTRKNGGAFTLVSSNDPGVTPSAVVVRPHILPPPVYGVSVPGLGGYGADGEGGDDGYGNGFPWNDKVEEGGNGDGYGEGDEWDGIEVIE